MLCMTENTYSWNFKKEYLYSKFRIFEFAFCILSFFIIFVIHYLSSDKSLQSFVSQVQVFIALYMAFRFGIIGMIISITTFLKDSIYILSQYLQNTDHSYDYLVALIFSFMSIFWVVIVGVISYRQQKYKKETLLLSITDELTGIYNKKYLYTTLENETHDTSRTNSEIGLILVDIDNFSMYNDLYGYGSGDKILKDTAEILKRVISPEETLFRFDGDGFAILVKNKDKKDLEQFAKSIHDNYNKLKSEYFNEGKIKKLTISLGLSIYQSVSKSAEELISHANTALYQAKNMGEDKVNFYQDVMKLIRDYEKSDQQIVGVFKGLLSTINAKDKYTFGHCERVSNYVVMVGEEMGMDIKEIQTLLHAGLLHDIGKIELPKSILNKIDTLSEEEYMYISKHPVHSANILEPLSGRGNLIDYVIHHHERYDGNGYPHGLKGEEISLGARILCVADCFDAMVSERPYRKGMSIETAFFELRKCSGTQFDPVVVQAFINAVKNKIK